MTTREIATREIEIGERLREIIECANYMSDIEIGCEFRKLAKLALDGEEGEPKGPDPKEMFAEAVSKLLTIDSCHASSLYKDIMNVYRGKDDHSMGDYLTSYDATHLRILNPEMIPVLADIAKYWTLIN